MIVATDVAYTIEVVITGLVVAAGAETLEFDTVPYRGAEWEET